MSELNNWAPPLCAAAISAEYVRQVRHNGPWAVHNVGRAGGGDREEVVWEVLEVICDLDGRGFFLNEDDEERDRRWDIASEAADLSIAALKWELNHALPAPDTASRPSFDDVEDAGLDGTLREVG